MRRLRVPAACIAALSIATAGSAIAAPRTIVEHVGRFDAIALHGRFRLDFTAGATQSVRLTGDPYLVENLAVSVQRGVLVIDRPAALDLPQKETVRVTITAPSLAGLTTKGFVRADLQGLSGRRFDFTNDGAAAATLSGQVGRFSMVSRGVASIDASLLHAAGARIAARGQANLVVYASKNADVTMYGEGRVVVLGHPKVHTFKSLAYGVITQR
ncbi:MAG TPA: DUF2807 domain-containing protein [Acidiphilium sp.]|uniref:GIN domain-containing protein n=1 Tax=unclassified Acidiphilium TaxID=2617493 RepID=UPI000BCF134D|nr:MULTISPECIES: DUF2807 domain-containing protein [unclassified Acidiphilium]OYV55587.1 MAG: DUF2807 domain-containing protein [Acidiphilium sp. 20-67-58]HQT60174.1 DUF2807 domain-containing protein [Acidiphilium sp.]HQU10544.1 DUF2807 domain-containing protein [Acidiphilium sp.]